MDPSTQRLFLFLDEWLWIGLCIYLLHRWVAGMPYEREERVWKWTLMVVVLVGTLMIYGIGYPTLWGWWHP
jgi:biotin transporter BioY